MDATARRLLGFDADDAINPTSLDALRADNWAGLRKLDAEASPAPWFECGANPSQGCSCGIVWRNEHAENILAIVHPEQSEADLEHMGPAPEWPAGSRGADMRVIAGARNAIRALLEERDELAKQLAAARTVAIHLLENP